MRSICSKHTFYPIIYAFLAHEHLRVRDDRARQERVLDGRAIDGDVVRLSAPTGPGAIAVGIGTKATATASAAFGKGITARRASNGGGDFRNLRTALRAPFCDFCDEIGRENACFGWSFGEGEWPQNQAKLHTFHNLSPLPPPFSPFFLPLSSSLSLRW